MAPASSHETLSGIGTVIEARQVKYWQRVPSVGSRPQYFRLAQVFGLPRMQNSHLRRESTMISLDQSIDGYGLTILHASESRLNGHSLTNGPVLHAAADLLDDARRFVPHD